MSGSYITLDSLTVSRLCQQTLKAIERERALIRHDKIVRRRNAICNGFFHKLFRCKDPTFAEVEVMMDSRRGTMDDPFFWSDRWRHEDETLANTLFIASMTGGQVHVSAEDYAIISRD